MLAYQQVDIEHRPERIRVLHTEHTVNELRADFADWANTSIPQHCLDLVHNISMPNSKPGINATQPPQIDPGQQQELADCFQAASKNFGSLTEIILSGAQKFIDRNGLVKAVQPEKGSMLQLNMRHNVFAQLL